VFDFSLGVSPTRLPAGPPPGADNYVGSPILKLSESARSGRVNWFTLSGKMREPAGNRGGGWSSHRPIVNLN
jgi:hypothetical protein